MKATRLTFPELGMIMGTRAALGAGIALLVSTKISAEVRRAVGLTLLGVGIVSTFPLVAMVWSKREE